MPETQELYTKLPKNVNMVSISADGNVVGDVTKGSPATNYVNTILKK